MSTAVDTAFEELMSADVAEPLHLVCGRCWPPGAPGVAVCGYETSGRHRPPKDTRGAHKCAKCIVVDERPILPCGHP